MKSNQQIINEIETQVANTRTLINNHKQEINSHENALQSFIKQLQEIKQNMKIKENKNNALNGANNIK